MYKILVNGRGPFSRHNYNPGVGKQVQLLTGIWLVDNWDGVKMWTSKMGTYEVWEVETPVGYTYVSEYACRACLIVFKKPILVMRADIAV